jgi:hypothetical protein
LAHSRHGRIFLHLLQRSFLTKRRRKNSNQINWSK